MNPHSPFEVLMKHLARIFVMGFAAVTAWTNAFAADNEKPPAATDPTGVWEFNLPAAATGRGRGRGAANEQPVRLDLKLDRNNRITGTIATGGGRNGAPGGNPAQPVEISDGEIKGNVLGFSAWGMDQFSNRAHYEGVLVSNVLSLTISRATPSGVVKTQVTAKRVEDRTPAR